MTQDELNIAIEKNRTALLRIVLCWLIGASIFVANKDRVLPRRFGHWVSELIFKAEKATYYLRVASGATSVHEDMPVDNGVPPTIGGVIARLKAIKKTLIKLRLYRQRAAFKIHLIGSDIVQNDELCTHVFRPNHSGLKRAKTCRAPPKKSIFSSR